MEVYRLRRDADHRGREVLCQKNEVPHHFASTGSKEQTGRRTSLQNSRLPPVSSKFYRFHTLPKKLETKYLNTRARERRFISTLRLGDCDFKASGNC